MDLELATTEATANAQFAASSAGGPGSFIKREEAREVMAALRVLRAYNDKIGQWAACLRCSTCFETAEELNRHYNNHRNAARR
jgi:hypothetical protein